MRKGIAWVVVALALLGLSGSAAAQEKTRALDPSELRQLEQLERQLQKEGKVTRRLERPGPPGLTAQQHPCRTLGRCWSGICIPPPPDWWVCLCWADRDCLDRQGER